MSEERPAAKAAVCSQRETSICAMRDTWEDGRYAEEERQDPVYQH